MKIIVIFSLLASLCGMIYFRVKPHDVEHVHRPVAPGPMGDTYLNGGFIHRRELSKSAAQDMAQRLDAIIRNTPRTTVLAGAVEDGIITYVTHSLFWGFPDYTTLSLDALPADRGDRVTLSIYGRLRFGRSDFQVNKTRIQTWLSELDADPS